MRVPKPKKAKRKKVNWCKILDPLCREIVFWRDGNRCVRCGKTEHLQWAHVLSRASHSIRWEPLNSMCLCAGCHLYFWHKSPAESGAWFAEKYPGRLDKIKIIRNNTIVCPAFYEEKRIELAMILSTAKTEIPLF